MKSRVIIITGGHSGLGKALTTHLAAQGADLIILYRNNHTAAQEIIKIGKQHNRSIQTLQIDVTDYKQVLAGFDDIIKTHPRIDALINCVGDFMNRPLDLTGIDDWHRMLDSNLNSVFYCCKAILPTMRKQKYGRIITMGVANADRIQAYSNVVPYAIAKTGVLIFTKSLARQEARHGITVNAISPGLFDNEKITDNEIIEQSKKIPLGKVGTGKDLLGALNFLLSDQAEYVTGCNLVVSGGWGL
ncbi:SDR family oxidoreductase [candidate division KSB1 bacterium]|nr:SDR family oxidoreductase [candidate division KSB1 bacterium]